jgi:hypothetical protein
VKPVLALIRRARRYRSVVVMSVLAASALVLSGCSVFERSGPPPPCPPVLLLKDTQNLTSYKPGVGRDITDVLHRVQLVDFKGFCEYDRERTKIDITLSLIFDVERGPANQDRKATFDYFAAIPKFHPAPEGKKVLSLTAEFKGNQTRLRVIDEIKMQIPLTARATLKDYAIYLGLQLSRDDLKEIRRRKF